MLRSPGSHLSSVFYYLFETLILNKLWSVDPFTLVAASPVGPPAITFPFNAFKMWQINSDFPYPPLPYIINNNYYGASGNFSSLISGILYYF